jgi:hypothetical protein
LLCDDHEVALRSRVLDDRCALAYRMNVLDALNDLLDAMRAQACRMNVLAYRMNVLDALNDLPDAMCALACRMNVLAYRMNVLAYRMNVLDALNDLPDAMCALACRKNELAYRKNALVLHPLRVDALSVRCDLVYGDLDARCDLKQTSRHESLALVGHPFRRRALKRSDVGCPLVRLQFPLT